MANGNGNGNGSDARQQAYQIWKAKRKARNEWGPYTPVFEALENFLIASPFVDLAHRILQLVLQTSWGSASDWCIGPDGAALSQAGIARTLSTRDKKVDRRRVNECIQMWRDAGVLRIEEDGRIIPIWSPNAWLAQTPRPERRPGGYQEWLRQTRPEEAAKREALLAELKALDMLHMADYRASRRRDVSGHSGQSMSGHSGQAASSCPECPDNLSTPLRTTESKKNEENEQLSGNSGAPTPYYSSHEPAAAIVPDTTPPPPIAHANSNSQAAADPIPETRATFSKEAPSAEPAAAQKLFESCRARASDCSDADVADAIREKSKAPDIRARSGFLLTEVPKMFDPDGLWKDSAWRRMNVRKAAAAAPRGYKYV